MIVRMVLAYNGPAFRGWQSQSGGGSVQDALEGALAKIFGHRVVVHGASRTDSGVHALGQSAHVEIPDWDVAALQRALNAALPHRLRVLSCRRAPDGFHSRFSARGKIYRYRIWNGPVLPPHEFERAWHVIRPVDLGVLREAAAIFVGEKNFAAFAVNRRGPEANTIRTVRRCEVGRAGRVITLTIEGDGFLYRMARMIAAASVRAAVGKTSVAELAGILRRGERAWNHVAPAEGLYLVRVIY